MLFSCGDKLEPNVEAVEIHEGKWNSICRHKWVDQSSQPL